MHSPYLSRLLFSNQLAVHFLADFSERVVHNIHNLELQESSFNDFRGVMDVGKHRGRFFGDILEQDPDNSDWASSLQDPSKAMIDFHKTVKRRRKRPREVGDDRCSICMDGNVDSAFIPCDHMTACLSCAPRLTACPICREPIADVLQTFMAAASTGSA